jgi:hypothetical protein
MRREETDVQITFTVDPTDPQDCAAAADMLEKLAGGGAKKAAAKPAAATDAEVAASGSEPASGAVEAAPADEPDQDALQAALDRTSELLKGGERARVMKALEAVGAGRVSEIKDAAQLADYLKLLTD